jgi:1-acyl-sn-glycerol-3-phosphate acyltransferase
MNFARSLLYVAIFYVWSAGLAIGFLPTMLLPPRFALAGFRFWSRGVLALLGPICGVRVEVRGRQYIPQGAGLIAAKHQCMLDTMALWSVVPAASYVTKKELLIIPVYGWYVLKTRQLVIDREGQAAALKKLMREGKERLQQGRQIIIFPEGTRTPPGQPADYKPGIAALYRELGVPCVPLATNSGTHWPAHGFVRHPGTIVYEFLEPIPAGLKRAEFMRELRERIETASEALLGL